MKFNFGFKYWFGILIIVFLLGLGISSIIASILAALIKKKEKKKYNEIFLDMFKVSMPTGYGMALVICFLFTLKKEYNFDISLLVLGSLFMSGIISFFETKNGLNLLIGSGSSLFYPILAFITKSIIKFVKYLRSNNSENVSNSKTQLEGNIGEKESGNVNIEES